MRQYGHQMVKDTSNFSKQCPDPFGAIRNLDIEELLNSKGKALFCNQNASTLIPVRQGRENWVPFVILRNS